MRPGHGQVMVSPAEVTNQIAKNYTKSTGTNFHGLVFQDKCG
jgi:hypothetical protein